MWHLQKEVVNFINILLMLFCRYFGAKILQSQNVTREKLLNLLSYEKRLQKMLMKLAPAVNFINVRRAFFVQISFWQLFFNNMYIEKADKTTFVRKRQTFNVDEIDGRR